MDESSLRRLESSVKKKILIEYQGIQHYEPVKHFGGQNKFNMQKDYDEKKRAFCIEKQIKLIEIPYTEFNHIDEEYINNIISMK